MTPLLPLDTWRTIMGFHPYHFFGMSNNTTIPVTSACNGLVKQYAWQAADAVGRSEINTAIETAEQRLFDYLGYSVAPRYTTATVPWPRYFQTGTWRSAGAGSDGRRLTVKLPDGYIQSAGVETLTSIGTVTTAGATLVFSDQDGDGIDDTFVATIATSVTDTAQIAIYFASADRLDSQDASERWRIRPVQVTISAGTATIRGRKWLLIKPVKYEGVATAALDPATTANFAASLEIYRRWTNPDGILTTTSQAVISWDTLPSCSCWSGCCGDSYVPPVGTSGSPYDPAATAVSVARVGIQNSMEGLVMPADSTYDSTTGIWSSTCWTGCHEPDRVLVRYLAGMPLENQQMAVQWQAVVARLAAAELARPVCACEEANRELYRWQFDLARTGGAEGESYGAVAQEDLSNPFGTRRGHVYAWRQVKNLRQLQGFLPG